MAFRRENDRAFGDAQADIREELVDYSKCSRYVAEHFADAVCRCGCTLFRLRVDDDAGAATRTCSDCGVVHAIGDSQEYLGEADLQDCECACGQSALEITVGVALYAESDDVRWLYLGCRCPKCTLLGCYGDWKNEFEDYRKLLNKI